MQWSEFEPAMGAVGWAAARISGLLLFCPFLGSDAVPAMIKVALTVLLTALLWPAYGGVIPAADLWHWTVGAAGEAMAGIGLGLISSVLFEGALLAGQVLSVPTGYLEARQVDLAQEEGYGLLLRQFPAMADLDWERLTFELDSYLDEVEQLVRAVYRRA